MSLILALPYLRPDGCLTAPNHLTAYLKYLFPLFPSEMTQKDQSYDSNLILAIHSFQVPLLLFHYYRKEP